mmetsp:Transcript_15435/g.29692  ORF Transcript_15435/g.29692 Transcript_15435/m.29692 type:complete len:287 (-) Transcript_15435:575-1435(-)
MPALSTSALHIPGTLPANVAKVHPLVLFNICDSYIRRNEGSDRVIGTLLGSYGEDGAVVVKNSYAVPHNESQGQVAVDIDFHRTMFELHHRANPKEVIVGWYSTGRGVDQSDALIQDFYARDVAHPVHLTLDTLMTGDEMTVEAYVSTSLSLGDKPMATHFHQIQVDLRMMDADRVGIELLKEQKSEHLPSDMDGLQQSISKLQGMIDETLEYVEGVCDGKMKGNKEVGRYLMDTIASVPRLGPESFSKLFNDSVQDVLLVMYLANMTRSQLILADKLNTSAYSAY